MSESHGDNKITTGTKKDVTGETGGSPAPANRGELIANSGVAPSAPAITRTSTATEIAATGTDNSLWFYWNIDGTPIWYGAQIAPSGTASTSPSRTRSNGGTEIAVAGP
jgi:hypothetical protein